MDAATIPILVPDTWRRQAAESAVPMSNRDLGQAAACWLGLACWGGSPSEPWEPRPRDEPGELSQREDHAAGGAATACAPCHWSIGAIGVGIDMDDEGTAILIHQRQRPVREAHSARDHPEQS